MIRKFFIGNLNFFPLKIWLIYSISTIFIYAFGPLDYYDTNKSLLFLYLLVAHISVFLGYKNGLKSSINLVKEKIEYKFLNQKSLNAIALAVFFSIILNYYRDLSSGLSLTGGFEDSFQARDVWMKDRGGGILGYLSAIISVFNIPFLSLGIIFYKHLTKFTKIVFQLLIIYTLYSSIAGASRHGLYMIICIMFISLLAQKLSNRISISFKKIFLIGLPIFLSIIFFSSYLTLSRNVNVIEDYSEYLSNRGTFSYSEDNFLIPNLEGNFKILNSGILQGYFYFTHSYSALSKALNLPFKGSILFFGHSDFMIRNFSRVFGEEYLDYSYFYRLINNNQHVNTQWITAYAWIASDTTFIGSFFLLYFFGSLLSRSWIRTIRCPNIASVIILAWMFYFFTQINITFVPNDLGQFLGFWGSIIYYKSKLK